MPQILRSSLFTLLSCLLFISCQDMKQRPARKFSIDTCVKFTPVRDQGQSNLCWVYAMAATIESEHLMRGDSVVLSTDWTARNILKDGAVKSFFSRKNKVRTRGMGSTSLRLMERYGAMPYDSYHSRHDVNIDVLSRRMALAACSSLSLSELHRQTGQILDGALGPLPRSIYMFGAEYTPREFAHSVYMPGEYVQATSFTHHPFGAKFVLEVPDNILADSFLNVPLGNLVTHVVRALSSGHPVCWEGDISEPGFSFAEGTATVGRKTVSQRWRQQKFESRKTTDDHCMELIGLAHDARGDKYVVAKNSWGRGNPYGGLMLMSLNYLALNTIAVYMTQEAWAKGE